MYVYLLVDIVMNLLSVALTLLTNVVFITRYDPLFSSFLKMEVKLRRRMIPSSDRR